MILIATLAGALTGCASGPRPDEGPAQVETFVGWIERVHVESELAKERAGEALVALRALVSPVGGDAMAAYTILAQSIERSQQQEQSLRKSVEPMKKAAEPVFARWERDLASFTSERLRDRSRQRLEETRSRYAGLVAVLEPALAELSGFNAVLRDHSLFLGNDLNSQSLAIVEEEVGDLTELAVALDELLTRSMRVSREYVETSAIPMRLETARPITR